MIFELKNIKFSFTKTPVLKDVSISVKRSRMTAIMGLNGSGKTTLLKLLSGYLKPHQGEIYFFGKMLGAYTIKELAREIAWIAQEMPMDFPFTVAEFVRMGRYAWNDSFFSSAKDFEIVHEVLNKLGLVAFAKRKLNELSGGERQRVLIARALSQQSPVILLDEPTNHLDIKHKTQVFELLKNEVKINNKSVVAVIHDLADARRYFDEVILLKDGCVAFSGAVADSLSPTWVKKVFEVDTV